MEVTPSFKCVPALIGVTMDLDCGVISRHCYSLVLGWSQCPWLCRGYLHDELKPYVSCQPHPSNAFITRSHCYSSEAEKPKLDWPMHLLVDRVIWSIRVPAMQRSLPGYCPPPYLYIRPYFPISGSSISKHRWWRRRGGRK